VQAEEVGGPVRESASARARSQSGSKVVSLTTIRSAAPAGKANAVRRQRERLAEQIAKAPKQRPAKTVAPASGRTAAFTLRLDAERHLRLRLASALAGRSAQQLVIEALDSMLASLPELAAMAGKAASQRKFPQKGDTP
jgi:predicted HicB family RNase H-like nuclease